MLSLLKKLAPIAGAIIGAQFGNPALGSALGGGIGSLLAGADIEDALKTAAIAGIGGYALKGAGPETTAAAAAPTASAAAQSGIMAAIKENPLMSLALGTTTLGLLSEEEEEKELTELEKAQRRTGERNPDRVGENIVSEYDYDRAMTLVAAQGGYIQGPGTGRSDSIDAGIFQNGQKVQEARLSDGEFVMTERAVRGLGNGDRSKGASKMYEMMRQYERMA